MNSEHTEDDEKTLMFARINHELSERELLEQERQGLLKKKQGLIADNKKRKDDLASLDKDLETFIDVRRLHTQATACERVMLTHTRLPNLYKRSSRSNTELSRAMVLSSRNDSLSSSRNLSGGVSVYLGECELRYPFRDSNSLRALITINEASFRLHVYQ